MSFSLFGQCPSCGATIPKGTPCPSCHHAENAPPAEQQQSVMEEYARRKQTHTQNYTIFMVLMFVLGVVGLLSAYCWFRTIFRGDVLCFFFALILGAIGAGIGYVLKLSKKFLPTEYQCPACNIRLDEMPLNDGHCPGCSAKLA
jgi:hypothetical protein